MQKNFIAHFKGLTKDAAIYGLGDALAKLINVLTAPILTSIFLPEDFGIISLLQTTIGFLVMTIGFNLNSGAYFYFFDEKDLHRKKVIISTSFFFYLSAGLLLGLAVWLGAPGIREILISNGAAEKYEGYDFVSYLHILAIGVPLSIVETSFHSLLRMLRLPIKYVALSVIQVLSNLAFILLLVVHWNWGIEGALWAGVLPGFLTVVIGFLMVVQNYVWQFSWHYMKLFLSYALPQFPSVILNWCLFQLNVFFINHYSPLSEQGFFAIAWRVAAAFLLFTTAFRLAWDPFGLSIMKDENAKSIYRAGYSLFVIVFGTVGAVIALFAKPILIILTPESYHIAYSIVFIVIVGFIYQGSNNILGIGIGISKKTHLISYAQVVAFIINLGLNFSLIPYFGAWGAAWAFTGGVIAQSLSYFYFAQKVYPIPYQFWRLQGFCFLLLLLLYTNSFLVRSFGLLTSSLIAIPFIFVIGFVAWKFGLSADERQRLVALKPVINKRAAEILGRNT